MATKASPDYTGLNVYQKLTRARQLFLAGGLDKSGKNPQLEFKYFELKDIVPKVTDIFLDLGLTAVINFSNDVARLQVVNSDNPTEIIDFISPMRFIEPNRGTNPLMALGATHTYLRRYMYMLAMDVCEPDMVDGGLIGNDDAPAPKKAANKKPATPAERNEIKAELTATDEAASDLQCKGLVDACNALMDKDPEQEEFIQELAMQTNGFKELTKSQCEEIVNHINEMLAQYTEG